MHIGMQILYWHLKLAYHKWEKRMDRRGALASAADPLGAMDKLAPLEPLGIK